ncbi:SIR2 family protein [Pseudomonas asiatica]|uniref:SIR2 family NAD-dependent protein deacylase n=1 Tax=Pseudomonas asiatica TaxID=2219225 RepID=UPI00209C5A78|nr:SIR2 family protein [Pseudomonas asiatica]MCO8261752.1 SIR2 family protein [Pseudomonas asiatica]
MSEYFEIAYAAASRRLCLFTGTGFSKAVTANAAPGWQQLLENLCDLTTNPAGLKEALFPLVLPNPLSLEEAAQVIALELAKVGRNISNEIAGMIRSLVLAGNNAVVSEFLLNNSVDVVTTNYDKLLEQLAGNGCHSLAPGLPVPRSDARVRVYHVHGSIDSPQNMVVTSEDYFKFINGESYFSRKLSTVLHENTVVILGYSLGDTNLKAIINEYRGFSKSHVVGSNIFLVSRSPVSQYVKDYYHHCYGVRVLDSLEVHDFFQRLTFMMPAATLSAQASMANVQLILQAGYRYTAGYLSTENSFYEIISSFWAVGVSINNQTVVNCLGLIIQEKIALTRVNGAWAQYHQMAKWLVYLGTILEIEGTSIEEIYLNAVRESMSTMRSGYYLGYSWDAYTCWLTKWNTLIASNRNLIKRHIHANLIWGDALTVVNQ